MLIIREEQMDAFIPQLVENFKDRVLNHVREEFPEQFNEIGEAGARDVIRYGIEICKTYDIDLEICVCLFIDLMFIFGVDFDQNPEFPWASAILNDETITDQMERVDFLWEVGTAELENTVSIKKDKEIR